MPRTRAMARKRIKRWFTFFFGVPRTLYEYVVTVDLSNTFRQHLVWSKKSSELKELVTARYSSSTVFLSLLVSSEIGILYSPSKPADRIREALIEERYGEPEYWTGLFVCLAIFFSVAALISNFTAWSVFMSLSNENAPIILRSTLGLYAAQLPSRLVTCAIYLFLCVVLLSCWVIMPDNAALFLVCFGLVLLFHIINTFSSISRIVIHSGTYGIIHGSTVAGVIPYARLFLLTNQFESQQSFCRCHE